MSLGICIRRARAGFDFKELAPGPRDSRDRKEPSLHHLKDAKDLRDAVGPVTVQSGISHLY